MLARLSITSLLVATACFSLVRPAIADGEILLTHAKALAGNVTPGDTPGYPITISIPGKFELASNLFIAPNTFGIQVTRANVTIDLNGFLMEGSNVAWYGIAGGVDGVTVRNGTIANFEFDGIVTTGDRWVVKDMQVVDNGRDGFSAANPSGRHRLHNNGIMGNGDDGIDCGRYCHIEANQVTDNGSEGVSCGACHVEGNLLSVNGSNGAFMVVGGLLLGNTILDNIFPGFATNSNGVGFGNNSFCGNDEDGIQFAGGTAMPPNASTASCN